ncbi:phosphoribosylaminoimidazole-succinocarboxamide synthase [Desulfurispirillum indicum S5]|uniref:Phosphoribosylaminoimidazole-succinocarboxamide synthase n=1 Tax=Desulfurispirillum indicum (strain ATCC BAA-1389 / DSM 22839 / S5) TaxID=653733 RepID=E6W192_DESIS|nr:phosphoribosylaminoimidazolesuccinocarboxamide synthase [Desulfurispirillum indicum]ADU66512.1 phosphoribosylaminoimidazole-succinocarboxamide synthase [Desulfurispirillum indicum S5]
MEKREKLYEGKAKILYATDDPNLIIQYFKDDATAFNAEKKGTIINKGIMNNRTSEIIFNFLENHGVPTHFVKKLNDREMLCKKVQIIPVEVITRNIVAGSLAKRLGSEEGVPLAKPVVEHCYKSDALGDPFINIYHIDAMGWATREQMATIDELSLKINALLVNYYRDINIKLVDMKLEFGVHKGQIILADEMCPDTSRLWDATTNEKMDKDRFRRDLGKIEESYAEVVRRIESRGNK